MPPKKKGIAMPPKKKGIAKTKKSSSRRSTKKKATAASDDDAPITSAAPAPMRVNTDPSNRQRTRARHAAAKADEISPVLAVELGADPDAYAKEKKAEEEEKKAGDKHGDEKVTEGEANEAEPKEVSKQLDAQAPATPAPAAAPEHEDDEQRRHEDEIASRWHGFCKENASFLRDRPSSHRDADLACRSLSGQYRQLEELHRRRHGDAPLPPEFEAWAKVLRENEDPERDERMERTQWEDRERFLRANPQHVRSEQESTDVLPVDNLAPVPSPDFARQGSQPSIQWTGKGFKGPSNHDGTIRGAHGRANEIRLDLLDPTLDPRDLPDLHEELAFLYHELNDLYRQDGRSLPEAAMAGYRTVLERVGPALATINRDGDTEEDRQRRVLDRKIMKLHKQAQTEAGYLVRPADPFEELDNEQSYKSLSSLIRDLTQLHQLRGDVDLAPELEGYKTTLANAKAIGQRVRAKQEADGRKHADMANEELASRVSKHESPLATVRSPVAKQAVSKSTIRSPVAGDKRQRSGSDARNETEEAAKRQKPEEEAAKLEELLGNTHNNAVRDSQQWAATGQASADTSVPRSADQPAFRADFPPRPSNSVTIDRSESDDEDTKSLFGGSDDGRDVPLSQQDAPTTPKPVASPAVARLQTPSGSVTSPTVGGSPVIRNESLPWVPKTPDQRSSPSIPSVAAQTPSSRQTSPTTPAAPQTGGPSPRNSSRQTSPTKSPEVPPRSSVRASVASSHSSPFTRVDSSGSRAYIPPPQSMAEDRSESFPARRSPTTENPNSLNDAINYTNSKSPEFVRKVEGKIRSPSIIVDGDGGEGKERNQIDVMSGRRVGEAGHAPETEIFDGLAEGDDVAAQTETEVQQSFPQARSIEELLAEDEAARPDLGETVEEDEEDLYG